MEKIDRPEMKKKVEPRVCSLITYLASKAKTLLSHCESKREGNVVRKGMIKVCYVQLRDSILCLALPSDT